ncbi:hypothetical protein LI012_16760, partial [Caldibacillus thermoamylovorans]|uniref:hypothetical protein n=1 Tax=Caldibacillus thermoamylovorans TaxID=35841 RepID=UPI001D07A244
MRQKHRKVKQKCLIERLYGTIQTENEAKLSHRSDQTPLNETKTSESQTKMSHRTALWDNSNGK